MRGDGHNMPPHMMHQFRNQQPAQQQKNGWSFSWINVVPIYTLCIVGYAIYIYFKAKSKPEEETRRNGIPKTELVELKDRLARTELALTKLMEATKLISDKIDPKELEQLVGNQEFLAGLLKHEEAKQDAESDEDDEVEDNDVDSVIALPPQSIEELEINSDSDSEQDEESDDENTDNKQIEETDEPIEIELKKVNDETPVRKRLVKTDDTSE